MKPLFFRSMKTGLMALGLVAGLPGAAFAGPTTLPAPSMSPNMSAREIMPVRDSWAGGNSRGNYWRHGQNRHWRGNNWRGDRWNHNGWHRPSHDGWRWRSYRRHYGGSGIYLGLGGLAIAPAYDYYAPRRAYRVYRGSGAHVRWCYNRYRSYRASDNTFQPYNGRRQQCYSPYR
ncbi:MAG TPA: BA14K family protein [Mesorhizobium sp.]|jgi:hypothetical protein